MAGWRWLNGGEFELFPAPVTSTDIPLEEENKNEYDECADVEYDAPTPDPIQIISNKIDNLQISVEKILQAQKLSHHRDMTNDAVSFLRNSISNNDSTTEANI